MNSNFKYLHCLVYTCGLLVMVSLIFAQVPSGMEYQTLSDSNKEVPVFRSLVKSAVIPGWGELSMGNKSGYLFLASEVLLWSSRFYFLEEVKLREEESYVYALQNAELRPGKYDKEFMELLTRYNSSGFDPGGYNEMVLIRAQTLYPNDATAQNQYILENAILDQSLFWSWGAREERRQYSIMRKNADHNRDYAKAVLGVIVANHVISAINAVRITAIRNRESRIKVGFDFDRRYNALVFNTEVRF